MDAIATLQSEIRALLRKRRDLKSTIRRISSQVDSDAPVTLLSTKASSEATNEGKRKLQEKMEVDEETEKRPKLESTEEHVAGHKRILRTSILAHLQRAKDALFKEREKESVSLLHVSSISAQTIKHIEKEQHVASKLAEQERTKLEELSHELREQLGASEEQLRGVEAELSVKNNELMVGVNMSTPKCAQKASLTQHYGHMSNFIATKTQPSIFWVPRNFNPELESLRGCTQQFVAEKVASIASTDYFKT
ncbi:nuclear factor NF2, putative [Babesia ovata]|uniref:Nuclear factor NF2, putative n=1 Tax=Babesia ovata TaxID=189622 RepID=A0A2H6KGX7_9APIC|nr:nuclear factor NF2, putative [Babesia ovata]GBE62245.1 nuclear factor NF2, putative [Babesia ovata]